MKIKVIKKNSYTEDWDFQKIVSAVSKSCARANVTPTTEFWTALEEGITKTLDGCSEVTVQHLHDIVECALKTIDESVFQAYANYRNYKKDFIHTFDEIFRKSQETLYLGDRENANFDSSLISTKGSIIRGYLTKELYRRMALTSEEAQAIEDGYIYIHDLRDLIYSGINCCLFDISRVMKGGFEMSGIQYSEPKTVLSALQVIGDITLAATAQQFGGFTLPELDKVLVPYYVKSLKKYEDEAFHYGMSGASIHNYAQHRADEELMQGLQSLEMKLNTVPCSRGDFAFTTISFGNLDSPLIRNYQLKICEAILKVRMNGQGKNHKPVVFPKLVYLHNGRTHENCPEQANLFDLAIKCNEKAMYPDYLDITEQGYVADIFNKTGKVISPMGCRAYLSDFTDDDGEHVFVGRANIGAVSLNLPMIYMKAKKEGKDFYEELDHWLQIIRSFLMKRYDAVAHSLCSTNPLAFTQGGLYHGTKEPHEHVGYDIVKSFTASFGITALEELSVLMNGCYIKDCVDGLDTKPEDILKYISDKVNQFKAQDGYLYALYGTPAESLCGTQLQQFRKKFGIIAGVSDKEYFTNSFHLNVACDVNPMEKQDYEYQSFHLCNGGHIQYVRIANPSNHAAIKAIVKRGMGMGFYQGINFDLAICEKCGHKSESTDKCDSCGSTDISVINRVCGYLGFTKVNGHSRMNDAKLAEIHDRVSM